MSAHKSGLATDARDELLKRAADMLHNSMFQFCDTGDKAAALADEIAKYVAPVVPDDIQQLMKFYASATLEDLMREQDARIERLRVRLVPTHDAYAYPRNPREG